MMVKIAIIDSGVKVDHPAFKGDDINVCSTESSANLFTDECGHGTAIYGILRRAKNVSITNIKITGIEQGVDANALIKALRYIRDFLPEINVVNLSLGTDIYSEDLEKVCDELHNKGIIIVSAFDNAGCISYPAAFDNVIGVVSSKECRKTNEFIPYDDDIVNIAGKGETQRVCWNQPDFFIVSGNSFACAHITVMVADYFNQGIDTLEKIRRKFGFSNRIKKNKAQTKCFYIGKAILFPFNKEMHSLIRFNSMLSFSIVGVYDIKYSATVGLTTKKILNDSDVLDMVIENIDNVDYSLFDTLILGHTKELENIIQSKEYITDLVRKMFEHGKKIYSFDDIGKHFLEYKDAFFSPFVNCYDLENNHNGMLYQNDKPILGIFGTSSVQGKFTLQLILRRELTQLGYKVGQIGTEPTSELFGFDYTFPMGYNSSVYLSHVQRVRYLNSIINKLCREDIDIILAGSQSGSVTYDISNTGQLNIENYSFLLGINPDGVILCVNPFDEREYIKRTIKFIESSVNCDVIAMVVYPLDFSADWRGLLGMRENISISKYKDIKKELEGVFHIPVYLLDSDKDIHNIVHTIERYFSETVADEDYIE